MDSNAFHTARVGSGKILTACLHFVELHMAAVASSVLGLFDSGPQDASHTGCHLQGPGEVPVAD